MALWSAEIKELEKLYESLKGQMPDLEKELERLIKANDENMILLYSRRCLEVIITDLCECELKRERGTEPLKGIIDKLHKERKVPPHIITSMHGLNDLSTYGTHPKDFDPEQIKPVLNNLDIIIKWYLKYKNTGKDIKAKPDVEIKDEIKGIEEAKKSITISRKRLAGILGGIISVIAAVFTVLYFSDIIGSGKQTKELDKSIAVLPFKLLSDEPDKQYLADGMMDAITLHLSKINDLRVLSRTSTEQYRNPTKTTTAIGLELGVEYLLEGSFQKFGDNVRLIVQLIKTGKEGHVWANEYDRNWDNVFSVQSEVAQTIAKELHASITPEEKQLIEKVPTSNMPAYTLYLKANDFLNEYGKTRNISSYYTSVNLYKETLQEDSTFARAYIGLANAYYLRYQWEEYFKENYLDSCFALVNKALSIDDQLDEAYYLKGRYFYAKGDQDNSLENLDRALIFNPNNYRVYRLKGLVFGYLMKDYIKCLGNFHKALTLIRGDEYPDLLRGLGYRYEEVGFINKAKNYYQEALDLDSDTSIYLIRLAWNEFASENFEEALKLVKHMYEIDSTSLPMTEMIFYNVPPGHKEEAYNHAKEKIEYYKRSNRPSIQEAFQHGYAFWQVGKKEEARDYFNQQIKYGEEGINLDRFQTRVGYFAYDLASTYAFLGEKDKAYQYLEEFDKMKFYSSWQISYAKHNPFMKSISNEERYQKILQNMESKYQSEHERVRKWLEEQGML